MSNHRLSRLSLSRSRRTSNGFTLIELLVVISIIAILAGLLLPVVSSVMEKAKKTEARSTESAIVAAVKNYMTDYGQYPVVAQATALDATFDKTTGDPSVTPTSSAYGHNGILFNVLRASNYVTGTAAYKSLNSRRINYFDGKDVKIPTRPRSGFIPAGVTTAKDNLGNFTFTPGDLVDPWGNLYYVRIDSDYSTMLKNPYVGATDSNSSSMSYSSSSDGTTVADPTTDTTIVRTDVISWSPGLDGIMGKGGVGISPTNTYDDVLSWQ